MERLYEQGYKCKECAFSTFSDSEIKEHINLAHQRRSFALVSPEVTPSGVTSSSKRKIKSKAEFATDYGDVEGMATVEEPGSDLVIVPCKVEMVSEDEEAHQPPVAAKAKGRVGRPRLVWHGSISEKTQFWVRKLNSVLSKQ